MIVFNTRKAYGLYCMRQIVLSTSLQMYIKHCKFHIKNGKLKHDDMSIYEYAIDFYELYLLSNRQSVDWNLKDN